MKLMVDITKKFKRFSLKVSFEHNEKFMGILGASGCGKTMALKCIAGIEKPDQGRIVLDGIVLFDSEKKINLPPQKRGVGYLFQNYALFPNMTVGENIQIVLENRKDRKTQVEEMLELFYLKDLKNKFPRQLSGGQQQRVALARIFAYEPQLILLDEPFSALDAYLKEQLQQELMIYLRKYQGQVMMVSHNRDEIFQFSERTAVFHDGKCLVQKETLEIFKNPEYLEAARLTGCKNVSRMEKISDHQVMALDWGMKLVTNKKVDGNCKYIGIRAHDIRVETSNQGENTCEVEWVGSSQGPYEDTHFLKKKGMKDSEPIFFKVNNNVFFGIPHFISMPKEYLMLLK